MGFFDEVKGGKKTLNSGLTMDDLKNVTEDWPEGRAYLNRAENGNPGLTGKREKERTGGNGPGAVRALARRKTAMEELDSLIGLDEVKAQVRKVVNMVKLDRERVKQGKPRLTVTHHLVFTGNPGTGKTTVARIIGRIFKEIGLLRSGHIVETKRAELVAGYTGQTAIKTQRVIDSAIDGVLFIDEAYSLVPATRGDSYGEEAINTLIDAMENHRDRLVVIVAGYRADMKRFVDSNEGLRSRFKTEIDFPDYDTESLFRIFVKYAADAGMRLSSDAQDRAMRLMESLENRHKGFGNARTIRNIFEDCLSRQAERMAGSRGPIDVSMFEADDIPQPGEKVFS